MRSGYCKSDDQNETPGGLASIRAFSATKGLECEGAALAGTSRILHKRIPAVTRMFSLDGRVPPLRKQGAAAHRRRCLGAWRWGGDGR